MSSFRVMGQGGGVARLVSAGDTLIQSVTVADVAVNADTLLSASDLITGKVRFTGTGGFDVTLPSATEIYNALVGAGSDPNLEAGIGFEVEFLNSTAGTVTFVFPADKSVAGKLGGATLATTVFGRALFKFASIQKPTSVVAAATNSSENVTLVFNNPIQQGAPIGPAYNAVNVSPGAWVGADATVFVDGNLVLDVISGPGGVTGFALGDVAAATATLGLNIGPFIQTTAWGGIVVP